MSGAKKKQPEFSIQGRRIGLAHPVYFIADIAANHDGDLDRAKHLVRLAKEAGADAAKFQHFIAEKIVSAYGFESMKGQQSHQAKWKKSVFQVYKDASVPGKWTPELQRYCRKVGIHFFSAPYDLETIDNLNAYVPAYKVGSGDIDWPESLIKIAKKKKPVLLATGAAAMRDVERAVGWILRFNTKLCLMQCNTNYTGSLENFKYVNLNVLKTYARRFPGAVLGLSDHAPGHVTVLGAVALGARVIEKHFTDDRSRIGPDHAFSMDPAEWRQMVDRTRELEHALGDGIKRVEGNELETAIIQRRSCRAARDLVDGQALRRDDIDVLRPVGAEAFRPHEISKLVGKKLRKNLLRGEVLSRAVVH